MALVVAVGSTQARAEPPIRGPEDAACRAEAKAKVFSAPNPNGLELEDVGRGLYHACMSRIARRPKAAHGHHHHGR